MKNTENFIVMDIPSAEKIRKFAPQGVRGFVLGTTLLFGRGKPYGETLQAIREMRF